LSSSARPPTARRGAAGWKAAGRTKTVGKSWRQDGLQGASWAIQNGAWTMYPSLTIGSRLPIRPPVHRSSVDDPTTGLPAALGAGREPDSGTVRRGFRTSARFRRSVASDPTGIRCLPSGGARSSTDCRQGMGSIEGSRIPRGPTGEEMDSRREPEPPVADKRVRAFGERFKTARQESEDHLGRRG
jgi:hypothetical protein